MLGPPTNMMFNWEKCLREAGIKYLLPLFKCSETFQSVTELQCSCNVTGCSCCCSNEKCEYMFTCNKANNNKSKITHISLLHTGGRNAFWFCLIQFSTLTTVLLLIFVWTLCCVTCSWSESWKSVIKSQSPKVGEGFHFLDKRTNKKLSIVLKLHCKPAGIRPVPSNFSCELEQIWLVSPPEGASARWQHLQIYQATPP